MLTLTRQGWGQANPAFRQMFSTLFFPDAGPEQTEWFNELQRISTSPECAERLSIAFSEIDVAHLLPKVSVPTLVLHVRDDAVVPFRAGRALASQIPGARLVALEGRNHLLLAQDASWPKVEQAIAAFLDEPI
jgi:pimeloyl-ACP methyl ester carboxylesterase